MYASLQLLGSISIILRAMSIHSTARFVAMIIEHIGSKELWGSISTDA